MENGLNDAISRQAASDHLRSIIDATNTKDRYNMGFADGLEFCISHMATMPTIQPGRLTDDDFEAIRIHLNAYKEKLCNQHRWKEAEKYQRIIDRFMAFASAQPEQRCVNCGRTVNNGGWYEDGGTRCPIEEHYTLPKDGYCHLWEKKKVWEDDYAKRPEEGEGDG